MNWRRFLKSMVLVIPAMALPAAAGNLAESPPNIVLFWGGVYTFVYTNQGPPSKIKQEPRPESRLLNMVPIKDLTPTPPPPVRWMLLSVPHEAMRNFSWPI